MMADLFWIKDGGPSDWHHGPRHRVAMDRLVDALVPFEKRYFDAPPTFNLAQGPATKDAPFRYVIVRVPDEEVNTTFPDEGYYHVRELEPEEARRLLRLPEK